MSARKPTVYAFIDSQNLNLGVSLDVVNKHGRRIYIGKKLNYKKFRDYLSQKYDVSKAYLFIGFVPTKNDLYVALQKAGFILIFKTVATYVDKEGKEVTKGNVDTDIVLYSAAILEKEYKLAIFVSGDGDFLSLYQFMEERGKLSKILVPNRQRYSKLLNEYRQKLGFVSDLAPLFLPNKKTRSGGRLKTLGLPGHRDASNIAQQKSYVNRSKKKQ